MTTEILPDVIFIIVDSRQSGPKKLIKDIVCRTFHTFISFQKKVISDDLKYCNAKKLDMFCFALIEFPYLWYQTPFFVKQEISS